VAPPIPIRDLDPRRLDRAMLEALVARHGPGLVAQLRRDIQRALRDVRRGFLLRDEPAYLESLVALEGLAGSVGALRVVMLGRSLEARRESSITAAGLDRLHWETERLLEALRTWRTPGEATLRRRRDRSGRFRSSGDRSKPPSSDSLPPA
jgi:hypothetical protein